MPPAEPATELSCPKCSLAMKRLTLGGVEVDRCTRCAGLWLDQGELEKLVRSPASVEVGDIGDPEFGKRMNETRAGTCPRDKTTLIPMIDVRQRHVQYESCNTCGGIFLDAGELTDLSEHSLGEKIRAVFKR